MSIIFNNTEIENVVFDGAELDKVVTDGVTVFEKAKEVEITETINVKPFAIAQSQRGNESFARNQLKTQQTMPITLSHIPIDVVSINNIKIYTSVEYNQLINYSEVKMYLTAYVTSINGYDFENNRVFVKLPIPNDNTIDYCGSNKPENMRKDGSITITYKYIPE
mgnify:CR=1 FL=1